MNCRRCGRELPEGDEKACPYCGIRQDTYIVPRTQSKYTRPKMKRGTMLSVVSVALVVFIVAVLVPVLRNLNRGILMEKIEQAYADQNKETLAILLANLKRSYPASGEEIDDAQEMLDSLLGKSTPQPDGDADKIRQQQIQHLIDTAQDSILQILSISFMEPSPQGTLHLSIEWKNTAEKAVSELRFSVEGLDASGATVPLHDKEATRAGLTVTGEVAAGKQSTATFLDVWDSGRVERAKLVSIVVEYADGSAVTLPQEVMDALYN